MGLHQLRIRLARWGSCAVSGMLSGHGPTALGVAINWPDQIWDDGGLLVDTGGAGQLDMLATQLFTFAAGPPGKRRDFQRNTVLVDRL